jgi:hypothetical protein
MGVPATINNSSQIEAFNLVIVIPLNLTISD